MQGSKRTYLFFLLLIVLPRTTWAEPVQLQYRFRSGEVLKYAFAQKGKTVFRFLDTEEGPQELDITARVLNFQKVTAVDRSQRATILMEFRDGNLLATMPKKRFELPFGLPEMTMKIAPNGAVLATETVKTSDRRSQEKQDVLTGISANSLNLSQFFGQMSAIMFPSKKLEIGDTWSRTTRFTSPLGETTAISTHSRLTRLTEVQGEPTAEIETTATFPMKAQFKLLDADITVEGTYQLQMIYLFSIPRGRLIRLEGTATVNQSMVLNVPDQETREIVANHVEAKSDMQFVMELQEST